MVAKWFYILNVVVDFFALISYSSRVCLHKSTVYLNSRLSTEECVDYYDYENCEIYRCLPR